MNRKLTQLAAHRQQLIAKAAAQRTALRQDLVPWHARLALVDRGVAILQYVGRHPIMMLGAAILLAALRPQRSGKWLQRGWLAWQVGRRLRRS
ncbi:MAG: YqjK-like family protein [Thiobacillaceae bacterium]